MKLKPVVATALAIGCALFAVATSLAAASVPGRCAFDGRFILGLREYQCALWQRNGPVQAGDRTGGHVAGQRSPSR